MESDAFWPKNNPGYDEGKYIEFIFSPNLIASSISSVKITNVYQKSADRDIAAKLEVPGGPLKRARQMKCGPAMLSIQQAGP